VKILTILQLLFAGKNLVLVSPVNNYVHTNVVQYVDAKNRVAVWHVDVRGRAVKLLTSCAQITYGSDPSVSKHDFFTIELKDFLKSRHCLWFHTTSLIGKAS
jgi:hypothetical protein